MRKSPNRLARAVVANAIAALLTHVWRRAIVLPRRTSQARHNASLLGKSEQPCNTTHTPRQPIRQPPSWASLPVDILAMLVQQLGDGSGGGGTMTIARLRLVCSAWSAAVDAVLEELELLQFPGAQMREGARGGCGDREKQGGNYKGPGQERTSLSPPDADDADWVSKFPVLKQLVIVKPGRSPSRPAGRTLASPHTLLEPPRPGISFPSPHLLLEPRPSSSTTRPPAAGHHVADEDHGAPPSSSPPGQQQEVKGRRLQRHQPSALLDDTSQVRQLGPSSTLLVPPSLSPPLGLSEEQQLSALLLGLHNRSVPLKRLSLFHDGGSTSNSVGGPASGSAAETGNDAFPLQRRRGGVLCSLPYGLTSLTLVSMAGETERATAAAAAVAPAAVGVAMVADILDNGMVPAAVAVNVTEARFDDIELPEPGSRVLRHLQEIKVCVCLRGGFRVLRDLPECEGNPEYEGCMPDYRTLQHMQESEG